MQEGLLQQLPENGRGTHYVLGKKPAVNPPNRPAAEGLFQLTFVPPQARASRHAAMHGESVAYSFGTIGQSVAARYGFRNEQVAAKAMQSRRGTGGASGRGK